MITAAGISISACRGAAWLSLAVTGDDHHQSAPTRNSPDTRTVQASDVSSAAASQRSARARSQAQKAAAQNSASVYGTIVKTAVGANSQATAAHGPPSRSSAAAARPSRPRR